MKTFVAVCLLCIAAGACDDLAPVFPLQRRVQPTLEMTSEEIFGDMFYTPDVYASGLSFYMAARPHLSITLLDQCTKPYVMTWEKKDDGYYISCRIGN